MSALRQIFYVSRVARGTTDRDIRSILDHSRRNNRMLDVTGCLACTGRHFAQVIEGRPSAVDALVRRIAGDPRHADVRTLVDRTVVLRGYPLWSMAYLQDAALADELEDLLADPPPTAVCLDAMRRLKPDTVLGAL